MIKFYFSFAISEKQLSGRKMEAKSQMLLKLEALKQELAAKSKKLEKSKHGAKVRAYVRRKVQEHNELDNLGIGTPGNASTVINMEGDEKPFCNIVDTKPGQLSSTSGNHGRMGKLDNLCSPTGTNEPLHSKISARTETKLDGWKAGLQPTTKAAQSSFKNVLCARDKSNEQKAYRSNRERICQVIEDGQDVTKPSSVKLKRAAKFQNSKSHDSQKNVGKNLDNAGDVRKNNIAVINSNSSNKNRRSLGESRQLKRNNETFVLCNSNSLSKPKIDSSSSATVNNTDSKQGTEFYCQRQGKHATRLNAPTFSEISTHKKHKEHNECKSSNADSSGLKLANNVNAKLCEDSLCFITPSFQSEKGSSEQRAVASDRLERNCTSVRGDLMMMSNADFLNVLGVSQSECIDRNYASHQNGRDGIHSKPGEMNAGKYDASKEHSIHRSLTLTKPINDNNLDENLKSIRGYKKELSFDKNEITARENEKIVYGCESTKSVMCIESPCPTQSELEIKHPVTDSLSSITTDSTSTSDYTELDIIPYSQFELTEDFLSETPSSQPHSSSNSRKRKGKGLHMGPLIKRKSPRLSSPLSSSDSLHSRDSLFWYKRQAQSLPAQKKAVAIMSVFQLLVDNAKNESSPNDYQLPNEFLGLMEEKSKELSGDAKREKMCVIEDSEVVDMSGDMKEKNFGKQEEISNENVVCHIGNKQIVIESSEVKVIKEGKEYDFNHDENKPEEKDVDKSEDGSDSNRDEFQPDKKEMALPAIVEDIDCELSHDLEKDIDDCSVIQSSYHNTPVKCAVTTKHNKTVLLQRRMSLNAPLFGREYSLARLALNNHCNIAKTDDGCIGVVGEAIKLTGLNGNGTLFSEKSDVSNCDTDKDNQRALSPLIGLGNDSSPSFMNSLSSTPKLERKRSKNFSGKNVLSPIAESLSSPLKNKIETRIPLSLPLSPECENIDSKTSQYNLHSLTSTPNPKPIQQPFPFSPIEKTMPPRDMHTPGFHEGDSSFQIEDRENTLKVQCPNDEYHKDIVMCYDDDCVSSKDQSGTSVSASEANSTSKTETRLRVGDDYDDINFSQSAKKKSDLTKNLEGVHLSDNSKAHTPKTNKFLDISDGKSPFSRYLEESIIQEAKDCNEKSHHSPVHVSPWQRIPKTSSTPLQIFETSSTASPRLLSPIFTPSRMARSRGRVYPGSIKSRSKKTLKFDGCFQSCSEDAVVQLLHGKLFVDKGDGDNVAESSCDAIAGEGKFKRYLVSIQASALTVWIQNENQQNDWNPELDWRLSAAVHLLHASILPVTNKIAIAASGWEKTEPIVTVFVYDFVRDHTLRYNIPIDGHKTNPRISQIHLCPFPSSSSISSSISTKTTTAPPLSKTLQQRHLVLGLSSDSNHSLHRVEFHHDFQGVTDSQPFGTLHRGKLNTLLLCQGQDKACVSLTWDQRITIWNTELRVAIQTISIPSYLPCLSALVDVRAIKGLLLMTASWRVEDVGGCGGILVWNPMTGCLQKVRVWNTPNAGWRSTEKTNKAKNHIYSTSSSGSVSWWDGRSGAVVGHRQSNIATCVSGMDDRHLVVGEMHGCVHLYSMY